MKFSIIVSQAVRLILVSSIICLTITDTLSQNTIYSPYSRFGIGDVSLSKSVANAGYGGSGIGMNHAYSVNPLNPASYSAFDSLSFVFDFALSSRISNHVWNDQSSLYSNTNIQYFTAGFPITKWWKGAFGLIPYSSVGYNLMSTQVLNDSTTATHQYKGEGGLNQFFLGQSFKLIKNLSVGANVSFLFGSLDRSTVSKFTDVLYAAQYRNTTRVIMQDLFINFGLQYKVNLKNSDQLTLGLIFDNKTGINAKTIDLTTRYLNVAGVLTLDTLETSESAKNTVDIPMQIGLGFSYTRPDKFNVLADVRYFDRSQVKFLGVQDSLKNSIYLSAGMEYIPQFNSPNKYWKRVAYRCGMNYYTTGIELNSTAVNQFGISFGLGLPLRRSKTMINFAFEAGTKGTIQNNMIREQYFVISAGLSLFDRWFVKPKFD
ncbi:MAG: hypothetical protein CVU05_04740 [Bacteroidetes bacterium HGW-Bacteroidetes-21]|jgi:hypothetical protein|nr:MAG: hypothetical protein CVU05_04740 [Bacteroidetes bacterium HGW-Bacteroidetes-21]